MTQQTSPTSFPETLGLICQLNSLWSTFETTILQQEQLNPAQLRLFNCIDNNTSISGKELAKKMGLSPSRASRVVESLVQKKLVQRINDTTDRRRCQITLSDWGRELKEKINKKNYRWQKQLQHQLSTQEVGDINSQLKKLINNLKTI